MTDIILKVKFQLANNTHVAISSSYEVLMTFSRVVFKMALELPFFPSRNLSAPTKPRLRVQVKTFLDGILNECLDAYLNKILYFVRLTRVCGGEKK